MLTEPESAESVVCCSFRNVWDQITFMENFVDDFLGFCEAISYGHIAEYCLMTIHSHDHS